ncbi:hypothetical protein V8E53_007244 [Lactarius tabidus]
MLWKIASFTALLLARAVQTLPQGELGELLWPNFDVPQIDEPKPNEPELSFWATYHTEPASTPSRVEHATPLLYQLSSSAARLATPIAGKSTLSHLTPTSQIPTPTLEGHTTQTSIHTTSTSTNTILPTLRPSPAELPQRNVHANIWRVVGIAVIAISVVGTTILAVVFFDHWWRFLSDVCGRRKKQRESGKEELVPDWERRSWEFRIEDNLPAYPSFGSPPVRQTMEEAASQTLSPRVHMRQPSPLSGCSNIPSAQMPSESSQRTDMRCSRYGSSGSNVRRLSPVMVQTSHYTLGRSDSQKTTTSEDAYGGLAAD